MLGPHTARLQDHIPLWLNELNILSIIHCPMLTALIWKRYTADALTSTYGRTPPYRQTQISTMTTINSVKIWISCEIWIWTSNLEFQFRKLRYKVYCNTRNWGPKFRDEVVSHYTELGAECSSERQQTTISRAHAVRKMMHEETRTQAVEFITDRRGAHA